MLMADTSAERLCQPVGIHAARHVLLYLVILFAKGLCERGRTGIVAPGVQFHEQLLLSIGQVITAQVGSRHIDISRIGQSDTSCLGLLGLYHHDAIGSLGTIDSLGGCILQDGHVLHTVDIQVEHLLLGRLKAVYDKERCVGVARILTLQTRKRGVTTDGDIVQGIRVTTVQHIIIEDERRIQVGKTLQDIGITHTLQILLVVSGGTTGKALGAALEDTIAEHLYLTEHMTVVTQTHILHALTVITYLLVLHAHKRIDNASLLVGIHIQGIVTIGIADGHLIAAIHLDGGSRQRTATVVGHRTSQGHSPTGC